MPDRSASLSADSAPVPSARKTSPLVAVRSLTFIVLYFAFLIFVMGIGQRLIIWPLITLRPSRRLAITRWWLRFCARATFLLARLIAGVRLTIQGTMPAEPVVVAMNHQSVLDIPLGVLLIPGPYPIIPTRDRYRRGLPGISPLARLARFPFLSHGRTATREELLAMRNAADKVAAGDNSLLIFPEGHRSRDGSIDPFMKSGLSLILARAHRPIYLIVADGMWHARTFADAAFRFAGTRVVARVLGPFEPPPRERTAEFLEELRGHMIHAIEQIRRESGVRP